MNAQNQNQKTPLFVLAPQRKGGKWRVFDNKPEQLVVCRQPATLNAALDKVQSLSDQGLYCVGFLTYEAGYALRSVHEQRLYGFAQQHSSQALPLCYFACYANAPRAVSKLSSLINQVQGGYLLGELKADDSLQGYGKSFAKISNAIAQGDCYQVNLSRSFRTKFKGSKLALFANLYQLQPSAYAAFIRAEGVSIMSLSPELFYHAQGSKITVQPMKGTAKPNAQDKQLSQNPKEMAENLMIVDLLRNDLSRLKPKSVKTLSLLNIMRLPTLNQMTSKIEARCNPNLQPTLRALFPSASITGAPKLAAMKFIKQLETHQRSIYCGAIGLVHKQNAKFNVSIRTAQIKDGSNDLIYCAGSGLVADSQLHSELAEIDIKTNILRAASKHELIETMQLIISDNTRGWRIARIDYHLSRLERSSTQLSFVFVRKLVLAAIDNAYQRVIKRGYSFTGGDSLKIRLRLSADGQVSAKLYVKKINPLSNKSISACLLYVGAITQDPLYTHKSTASRLFYQQVLLTAQSQGCHDCLLVNEQEQVCESANANICYRLGDKWYTPPASCGLLPGTRRQYLLEQGKLQERKLTYTELKQGKISCYRINALTACQKIEIIDLQLRKMAVHYEY